jgi:hypothetical protein
VSSPFFSTISPAVMRGPGALGTLVIDAEEDFDWEYPIQGTQHSTAHMKNIRLLHTILSSYGIVPTYLLTWPVLENEDVVRIIRTQLDRGQCEAGIQLHPWVTPPFDDVLAHHTSFSGNLDEDFEEKKLVALKTRFREVFGFDSTIYRSGRYGLGSFTSGLLEKHGFLIDTSVAPRTSYRAEGGPDYSLHDYELFWFGRQRRLLEIPLCRSIVGWAGGAAPGLYRMFSAPRLARLHVPSILTRSRCAERITLSPEGNDVAAMRRLVLGLRARGQHVFALSFHSSSLQPGRNPYVRSRAELHGFYDRLSAILDCMVSELSVQFASISQIPGHLAVPAPAVAAPAILAHEPAE